MNPHFHIRTRKGWRMFGIGLGSWLAVRVVYFKSYTFAEHMLSLSFTVLMQDLTFTFNFPVPKEKVCVGQ